MAELLNYLGNIKKIENNSRESIFKDLPKLWIHFFQFANEVDKVHSPELGRNIMSISMSRIKSY